MKFLYYLSHIFIDLKQTFPSLSEAADTFGPGDHASTYGGNPLACAAGLAVAEYLSEHDILANVQARGAQLEEGLAEITKKYPSVLGEVRGWGLLKGVVINDDAGCTAAELVGDAMEEGLLLVAAGPSVESPRWYCFIL